MLYQLSYASQMYRKPVAWGANERGTQPPAAITAQTIRLAQGMAWGKLPATRPGGPLQNRPSWRGKAATANFSKVFWADLRWKCA